MPATAKITYNSAAEEAHVQALYDEYGGASIPYGKIDYQYFAPLMLLGALLPFPRSNGDYYKITADAISSLS